MFGETAESIGNQPFGDAVILSVDDDSRKALLALLSSDTEEPVAPTIDSYDGVSLPQSAMDDLANALIENAFMTDADADTDSVISSSDREFDHGPVSRFGRATGEVPVVDPANLWTDGIENPFAHFGIVSAPAASGLKDAQNVGLQTVAAPKTELTPTNVQYDSYFSDQIAEELDSTDISNLEDDAQPQKVGRIKGVLNRIKTKIIREVPVVVHGPQVEGVKIVESRHELSGGAFISLSSIAIATCMIVGFSMTNNNDASPQEEDISTTIVPSTIAPETTSVHVSRYTQKRPVTVIIAPPTTAAERNPALITEPVLPENLPNSTVKGTDVLPETPSSFDMVIVDGSNFTDTVQTLLYGSSGRSADHNKEVNSATRDIIEQYAHDHSMTTKAMNHFDRGANVTIKLTPEQQSLKRRFDISRLMAHR